jgi:hypothetical protein
MREIDCAKNELICAGEDLVHHWPLKTRSVVKALEKKEVYCSWFQAAEGDVESQFPALRVQDKYYSMPLRIQKSIFRHMRLHAAFVNRESTATGVEKLRIPTTLLREKLRTARRFMVRVPWCAHPFWRTSGMTHTCGRMRDVHSRESARSVFTVGLACVM